MLFDLLLVIDNIFWSYIGFILICISGIYLTVKSRAFQFKEVFKLKQNLSSLIKMSKGKMDGISPFKLYFASVGGSVGLGNIVNISTAVMIGGPGSVFWMWIACFSGMLIKYSEIYLGVKYRVKNNKKGYDGGHIYYLKAAFSNKYIPYLAAFLFCIYGVEVFQFVVLVDQLEYGFDLPRLLIIILLLISVFFTSSGGVKRLASICFVMMPFFMIIYILVCLYIIFINYTSILSSLTLIIKSAFYGHGPIGGFLGSSMLLAAYMGTSKAVYSGDIGIGYDSMIQSESKVENPRQQAIFSIYSLLSDTIICTLTCLVLIVTGAWNKLNNLLPLDVITITLKQYLPFSDLFLTLLIFFAGFTTIIAYFTVGTKCAKFINKKYGVIVYWLYGGFAFIYSTYYPQDKVALIMGVTSGLLLLINVLGILKLRKHIEF